ncbi:MAG: hypothetical protein R3A79_07085 [Nannocystaceae bacterium]
MTRLHSRAGLVGRLSSLSLGLSLALLVGACADSSGTDAAAKAESSADASADKAADAPPKEAMPAAEELLAASVDALGGAANFEAIRSYYVESQMNVDGLGLSGTAQTWWAGGDFYVETDMPGVGLVRLGSQGDKIWSDDPINGMRMITGIEAEQAAWSTSRCLALDWKRYFDSAETTALVDGEGGRRLAEITFKSAGGDEVILRLDAATKMPVSQSFKQANPLGSMPVTVTFDDFREVAGTQVAYKQFVDASLTKMSSVTNKFEVNVEVPSDKFAPPGPQTIRLPDEAAQAPDKLKGKPDEAAKPVASQPAK